MIMIMIMIAERIIKLQASMRKLYDHRYHHHYISDTLPTSACGNVFDVHHAMMCRRGGFNIQRHNEISEGRGSSPFTYLINPLGV